MSRLEPLRASGHLIFLAVVGVAMAAACADNGYLAVVGPPNLRFASGRTHDKFAPTRIFLTNTNLDTIPMPTAPNAEDTAKTSPATTKSTPDNAVVMKADSTPSPSSVPTLNFTSGGADPNIVTSQMLVDYLRPSVPGKNNNNSPGVVVPVSLGFTPPSTATPENASRADYSNQ